MSEPLQVFFKKKTTEYHLDNSKRFNVNKVEKVQLENSGRFYAREVINLKYFNVKTYQV